MPDSTEKILPLASGQDPGSESWWASQLDASEEARKTKLEGWRQSAKAYADELTNADSDAIRVNIEFEKTEQKRHKLFFRVPALRLKPTPRTIRDSLPQPPGPNGQPIPPRDLKKAVAIFREVLTRLAGPKGANTKAAMDEILFDVLCPAGIGFVKVGYERYEDGTIPIQVGQQPDPNYQQPGAVLGLRPVPMVPVMQPAPNVVCERYYASRISGAMGLIPAEFRQSDYSGQADWLGHDFAITPADAKRRGWPIPANASTSYVDDDDRIIPLDKKIQRTGQIKCRVLYYYASRVDPTVIHPDKIRMLVFVAGHKTPVVHCDFKDQRFDARGRFVAGFRTLPIKVLTLRYVSDMAYPPSDCRITRRAVNELSDFRTIQMRHKRKAAALRWLDIHGILDETIRDKVLRGEYADIIPTDGPGDRFMGQIADARYPPDNVMSEDRIMADINRAFALGANSSGVQEKGGVTATEIASIAQATANRLGGETEAVMRFWLSIVEALGCLVQLYADHEDYVTILGENGAQIVEAWTKDTIQGEFLYEVVPNSALAPDASADQDLALNRYNLVRNDPCINPEQLLRDTLDAYGTEDVDQLVHPLQPPPTKPEPPRLSVSFNGQDFNPANPQYENVLHVCNAAGIPLQAMATPDPNAAPQPTAAPPGLPPNAHAGPAPVIDRERLRMAGADANRDARSPVAAGLSK